MPLAGMASSQRRWCPVSAHTCFCGLVTCSHAEFQLFLWWREGAPQTGCSSRLQVTRGSRRSRNASSTSLFTATLQARHLTPLSRSMECRLLVTVAFSEGTFERQTGKALALPLGGRWAGCGLKRPVSGPVDRSAAADGGPSAPLSPRLFHKPSVCAVVNQKVLAVCPQRGPPPSVLSGKGCQCLDRAALCHWTHTTDGLDLLDGPAQGPQGIPSSSKASCLSLPTCALVLRVCVCMR